MSALAESPTNHAGSLARHKDTQLTHYQILD
jgi:hypothetical protein